MNVVEIEIGRHKVDKYFYTIKVEGFFVNQSYDYNSEEEALRAAQVVILNYKYRIEELLCYGLR